MPEHPDTLIWVAGVKPALEIIEVEKYVIRRSASRDSTAIVGREKPAKKTKKAKKPRKRGRLDKGEKRELAKTRLARQIDQ